MSTAMYKKIAAFRERVPYTMDFFIDSYLYGFTPGNDIFNLTIAECEPSLGLISVTPLRYMHWSYNPSHVWYDVSKDQLWFWIVSRRKHQIPEWFKVRKGSITRDINCLTCELNKIRQIMGYESLFNEPKLKTIKPYPPESRSRRATAAKQRYATAKQRYQYYLDLEQFIKSEPVK